MSHTDKRIDAYIDKAADFAKPVLTKLRALVHQACPEVKETIKWGFPHFEHKGLLCSMAAFKQHCVFGFWKHKLMKDTRKLFAAGSTGAMGSFGRITGLADLPKDKILIDYIAEAARLNEEGVKAPAKPKKPIQPIQIPEVLSKALAKNAKARQTFEGFSPSHRREYVNWIVEAKREETRERRLKTALEWLSEGKARNWKYENC